MSDGIDLGGVEIHNSPDIRGWAPTATITKLIFRPNGVHVEHTKNVGPGAWPNFRPPTWDGDLQYTLWILLRINGQWHGSGCIQFWQACDQNGGPPEEFAKNWYYAADRWAPMTGHQPKPGELVGFLVTAGDARNNGIVTVRERSNVVAMPFPSAWMEYVAPDESLEPPVVPVPVPEPPRPEPPKPAPTPDPNALIARLNELFDLYNQSRDTQIAQAKQIEVLQMQQPQPQPKWWKGQARVYGLRVSVVCDAPQYTDPPKE